MTNLVLMSCFWVCACFNYYLIGFNSKYLPGDVFDNVIALNASDMVANLIAGVILRQVDLRYAISFTSIVILLSGILISSAPPTTNLMPLFLILARSGAGGLFAICYVATASMFPTLILATAFGICNITARTFTIFAPQLAEKPAPYPMLVLCLISGFSAVAAHFLYDKVTMVEE